MPGPTPIIRDIAVYDPPTSTGGAGRAGLAVTSMFDGAHVTRGNDPPVVDDARIDAPHTGDDGWLF